MGDILSKIIAVILSLFRGAPLTRAEMEAALDRKAAAAPEKLDWRNSIVDLMKLTGQDSSLQARERMASELGYSGPLNGSAEMNIWLHSRVMEKLSRTLK